MGFMKQVRESVAQDTAEKLLGQLAPADGLLHIAMFHCMGSMSASNVLAPDTKFNQQADYIVSTIQRAGRQVMDIKVSAESEKGFSGNTSSYNILITYR